MIRMREVAWIPVWRAKFDAVAKVCRRIRRYEMNRLIRHVIVRGVVQGVGYRAFVADEAARLGLEGWVRNRRDGTVEAVFAGSADLIDRVIAVCRRGPWGARIDAIEQRDGAADELVIGPRRDDFSVLPTA